jgi:hypothetical protein
MKEDTFILINKLEEIRKEIKYLRIQIKKSEKYDNFPRY